MKKYLFLTLFIFALFFSVTNIYSVPAYPYPIKITQPDGSVITIRLRGDEYFKYKTTLDGYLLTPNADGVLTYAEQDATGKLISTMVKATDIEKRTVVEKETIKQLNPNQPMIRANIERRKARISSLNSNTPIQKIFPITGTPSSLVILVNFAGATESFVTPTPKEAFDKLLNQSGYAENGGTGSANDYFVNNSSNVFSPTFDVVGPYTLPNEMMYYGENDLNGDDKRPQQMVIDACRLASNNGVDFSKYDTDNDGFVDNIFIYYAGHNEAENAGANTVWPHRWSLANYSTKFNGKIIYDYACTSELKSASGSTMCGIGTFCHEFGHVLGLPDYYATNNATHQTLSYWNIMDSGAYLNGGKTPPAYSAYDRFYLNWLTPTEITTPLSLTLDPITTSNNAFIITQYGNHNLNGQNPVPVEFFTLENRQKNGWDAFLPGDGMLITRINYNASDWADNSPNNSATLMGVDIIEADRFASDVNLSGDPFPGTTRVTSYSPVLRSGVQINKDLTNIVETDGVISFDFLGGSRPAFDTPPIATNATAITTGSFACNWNTVNAATGYYITGYSITEGESQLTEGFENGLKAPVGWALQASATTISSVYSGKAVPAIQFKQTGELIKTEKYILPVKNLSFYIRSVGGTAGKMMVEGWNGSNWEIIESISVVSSLDETKNYTFSISKNYTQFRQTYTKGSGDVAVDDITVTFFKKLEFSAREKWVETTSDTLMNLLPNKEYFYKVRASDKTMNLNNSIKFEDITDFSNIISVKTLDDKVGNIIRVKSDGTVIAMIPTINIQIRIYNTLGQLVKSIKPNSIIFEIKDLPKGCVYMIDAGNHRAKFMVP